MKNQLLTKIHDHSATVAVTSTSSVQASAWATWDCRWPWRLPRAAFRSHSAALSAGVGIDVDPSKVDAINQGRSYISDIRADRLAQVTVNPAFAIHHSPIHH